MKILILAPAPGNISPGQRFRFEHYLAVGKSLNYHFTTKSFFTTYTWGLLHKQKHVLQKSAGIIAGLLKRTFTLFTLYRYDFVYVYREVAPVGPPVFEWLISKVFRKKIIYDFDDAIWINIASVANPMSAGIKCTWKVGKICKYSTIVTVGNEFLAEYARHFCEDVRIIPTVVNTAEGFHHKIKNHIGEQLTIGWTGTYTNFKYLEIINPVIRKLKEKYDFNYLIIANKNPELTDIDYTFRKWEVSSEISDLLTMHIGLMPLENTEIEKGKCGFKAIQYMSLGIPAVVSPVGVNKNVVHDGENGFWANGDREWYNKLELLINDPLLRSDMGQKARMHIVDHYSVAATEEKFLDLFTN